jgi:hypothetical protein
MRAMLRARTCGTEHPDARSPPEPGNRTAKQASPHWHGPTDPPATEAGDAFAENPVGAGHTAPEGWFVRGNFLKFSPKVLKYPHRSGIRQRQSRPLFLSYLKDFIETGTECTVSIGFS